MALSLFLYCMQGIAAGYFYVVAGMLSTVFSKPQQERVSRGKAIFLDIIIIGFSKCLTHSMLRDHGHCYK